MIRSHSWLRFDGGLEVGTWHRVQRPSHKLKHTVPPCCFDHVRKTQDIDGARALHLTVCRNTQRFETDGVSCKLEPMELPSFSSLYIFILFSPLVAWHAIQDGDPLTPASLHLSLASSWMDNGTCSNIFYKTKKNQKCVLHVGILGQPTTVVTTFFWRPWQDSIVAIF